MNSETISYRSGMLVQSNPNKQKIQWKLAKRCKVSPFLHISHYRDPLGHLPHPSSRSVLTVAKSCMPSQQSTMAPGRPQGSEPRLAVRKQQHAKPCTKGSQLTAWAHRCALMCSDSTTRLKMCNWIMWKDADHTVTKCDTTCDTKCPFREFRGQFFSNALPGTTLDQSPFYSWPLSWTLSSTN